MNYKKIIKEIWNDITTTKSLIIVDVQPEYEKYISFSIEGLCEFINEKIEEGYNVGILFNGEDTLGMISKNDLIYFYLENGLNEEYIDDIKWYDKGFAFFRYCIDIGVSDDDIVKLIKFMNSNDIYDSRYITDSELWNEFEEEYDNKELRELLEFADDNITLPELMDWLKENYGSDKIFICGGGVNECLKEVEIALLALDKKFEILKKWSY